MLPDTKERKNWSTFTFWCPVDKVNEVLCRIFKNIHSLDGALLPHYKVAYARPRSSVNISLRILRIPSDSQRIETLITTFLKNDLKLSCTIDPGPQHDHWISKRSEKWDLNHCKALNLMSELVV